MEKRADFLTDSGRRNRNRASPALTDSIGLQVSAFRFAVNKSVCVGVGQWTTGSERRRRCREEWK